MADATEYVDTPGGFSGSPVDREKMFDTNESDAGYFDDVGESASGNVGSTHTIFDAIPSGATIVGIEVIIKASCAGDEYLIVHLNHPVEGASSGTDTITPTALGEYIAGGPTELWGESWTVANVQDDDFGVGLDYETITKATELYVYFVKLKVYYTVAGASVTAVVTIPYNIRNSVTHTSDLKYHIRNVLTKVSDVKYSILKVVEQTSEIVYTIRNSVCATSEIVYNIRNRITNTVDVVYDILGDVVQVVMTSQLVYNIRNSVDKTSEVVYDIRNGVAKTSGIVYNIRNGVTKTSEILYNIRNTVANTSDIKYHIRNAVDVASDIVYDIRGSVSKAVSFVYDIRNRVTLDSSIVYSIRNAIVATSDWLYDIRASVSATVGIVYDIRNSVVKSFEFVYDILAAGTVTAAFTIKYNIRKSVSTESDLVYSIRKSVSAVSTDIKYHIRNFVTATADIKYDIYGLVTALVNIVYRIRGGVGSPYTRLFDEAYDYLEGLTESGGSLEGFMIYKRKPKNRALFFPCVIVNMEHGSREAMMGGEYSEMAGLTFEVMFRRDHKIEIFYGERHIILMKERLSRYYRDKLINILRDFESETIKTVNKQITGATFGPSQPKHTLYGATVMLSFTFKGGDDWEIT